MRWKFPDDVCLPVNLVSRVVELSRESFEVSSGGSRIRKVRRWVGDIILRQPPPSSTTSAFQVGGGGERKGVGHVIRAARRLCVFFCLVP